MEKIYAIAVDLITERDLRNRFKSGEITEEQYKSSVNSDFVDEFGVCDHCIANAVKRALGDVPAWASKSGDQRVTNVSYLLNELGYEVTNF